jgi:predicted lipoprotein
MKRRIFLMIPVLVAAVLFFAACNKSDSPGTNVNGFDKTGMLTQYIDGIILPGYTGMQGQLIALQAASDSFLQNPTTTTQASLKTAYNDAHLQYERIAAFQFGPAENALLDLYLNYSGGLDYSFNTSGTMTGFSVDTATIESNITSGSYTLTSATRNSFYAQGFPALDYLYFAPNAIGKFSSNTAKRVKYVQDLVTRMKSLVDNVASGWTTYRSEFIANTQTNVGSPIGNIVNQLAYQLDLLKGPRIGWPLGKQSNGIVFAEKTEAYYSGHSATLAVELLSSLKNIYTGGGSGKGLSDYLIALQHTQLNTDVIAQFDVAINALKAIPDPLSNSLVNQGATVDAAYKEIQKLVTVMKTDVASATGVQINYMDNDGD